MTKKKRCHACGVAKPLDEFQPRKHLLHGVTNRCSECLLASRLEKLAQNPVPKEKVIVGKKVLPVVHTNATDPVNSPGHYKTGGIECIDAMIQVFGEDAVRTYARINAFKYIWRHNYKGKPEEDLAKAAWYTRFANGDDPRKEIAK